MKVFILSAVLVLGYLTLLSQQTTASNAMQHSSMGGHVMINANDFKWGDAPPALPKGSKVAVLSGDPAKEGPFTLRVMFPENYNVPPHWHPTIENVVVLEGTLYMGSGEKIDESKAVGLTEGGYSSIPAKSPHYVYSKDKCTFQVNGMGPFEIVYINPADDPRKK